MDNLNTKAWLGFVWLAVVMGVLLFVPAGTLGYWQAWAYLAVFFGSSALITLYLMKNDRALLARRLRGGPTAEKLPAQRFFMLLASIGFIAILVVPALDYRFHWSHVPLIVVIAGDVLNAIWFYIEFLAFKENTFTSSTIEIAQGQRVVSTGPYAIIRHPMYAGGFLLFLGTPIALGSYWGLFVLIAMLPALIGRLLNEEHFLATNLAGYREYCLKVRWRLIPGVF